MAFIISAAGRTGFPNSIGLPGEIHRQKKKEISVLAHVPSLLFLTVSFGDGEAGYPLD